LNKSLLSSAQKALLWVWLRLILQTRLDFLSLEEVFLSEALFRSLKEWGFEVFEPFYEARDLDFAKTNSIPDFEEKKKYWQNLNDIMGKRNCDAMKKSDLVLALLDGGPDVDSGVASEIGYYAALKRGPILALRSDLRGGENIGTSINLQVAYYIIQSGGFITDGDKSTERWYEEVKKWHDGFVRK